VPFEEAKAQVEKTALQERQLQVWNDLMDGLRKEIPFELVKPAAPAPAPQAPEAPKPAAPKGGGN
jgi:hypothetical protein